MSARIVSIATQVPEYQYAQNDIAAYMQERYRDDSNLCRQINALYKKSAIDYRHSVLPDFDTTKKPVLFQQKPLLSARLEVYNTHATPLAIQVAENCLLPHFAATEVTHLITVSCTGLHAPGIEIQLIKALGLNPSVQRHPINFVGCYASIPALNLAKTICASVPNAIVLIVSVELCTLHFNDAPTRDNLLANALFADGAAACLVVGDDVDIKTKAKIGSHHSVVHPASENEMAWTPHEEGFLMKLSSYVPAIIEQDIVQFVRAAAEKSGIKQTDFNWAFHPGGAQILHKIMTAMELQENQIEVSYAVLRQFGNMSSATILFVLQKILEVENLSKPVFACAFGPGLTFESIIIEHV